MAIYDQPDYQNERNKTNAYIANMLLDFVARKKTNEASLQQAMIQQGYVPNSMVQAPPPNLIQRFLGAGRQVPQPDPSAVPPQAGINNPNSMAGVPTGSQFNPFTGAAIGGPQQPQIPGYTKIGTKFDPMTMLLMREELYRNRRDYQVDNPLPDQDTRGAAAAYSYSMPRLKRIKDWVDTVSDEDFKNLFQQVQIGANNDLIVPDGSPLEDVVGAINDIRLTGFGLGGKNFTENEAKIVFGRLNPVGKSKERWIKDLSSLPDYFKEKIQSGVGGRDVIQQIGGLENPFNTSSQKEPNNSSTPSWVPSGFNYKEAIDAGYTDEEIKKHLKVK